MQASQPEPIPGAPSGATPLVMPVTFLRLGDVMRVTGLGRSTVYRLMADLLSTAVSSGAARGRLAQPDFFSGAPRARLLDARPEEGCRHELLGSNHAKQLELLDASPQPEPESQSRSSSPSDASSRLDLSALGPVGADVHPPGQPLLLPLAALLEDPANPRTEFPAAELNEPPRSSASTASCNPSSCGLRMSPGAFASTSVRNDPGRRRAGGFRRCL